MQYQGGKSRIANNIKEVILDEISRWKVENSQTISTGYNGECRERERERVMVLL